MAITDKKITSGEIADRHVQRQPDRLEGTASQNKAVFDSLPEFTAKRYNEALDEIQSEFSNSDRKLADVREDLLEEIHSNPQIDPEQERKTAYNKDFEDDSDNIQPDGIASAGFSGKVARADHVHPENPYAVLTDSIGDVYIQNELDEENTHEANLDVQGHTTVHGRLILPSASTGIRFDSIYNLRLFNGTFYVGHGATPTIIDGTPIDFNTAFTVEGHDSVVGTMLSGSDTKEIQSGSSFVNTGVTITLGKGSWVVNFSVRFASNNTGVRKIALYTNEALSASVSGTNAAPSGYVTHVNSSCSVRITLSDSYTYRIYVLQNSGVSLSCDIYWRAMRVA